MTIFVDKIKTYTTKAIQPSARRWGKRWSHMWTDSKLEELHLMAKDLGLKRSYFQDHTLLQHYDVTPPKRELALSKGAVEGNLRKELLKRFKLL